jgi:FkbM family methyltransferase
MRKIIKFLNSFLECWKIFNFIDTLKIKLFYRIFKNVIFTIKLKKSKKTFSFRTLGDIGAVMHFVNPNYHILSKSKKIKTIIDLGANIGSETIRFAINHPESKIFSVEAQVDNFSILKLNVEKNNFKNIKLYNRAAFSEDGIELTLFNCSSGANRNEAFSIKKDTSNTTKEIVSSISINQILNENNLDEIDILKIDIEGAEKYLFSNESNLEWLKKTNCLIFECPDSDEPFTTQLIYNQIIKHNMKFRTFICGENLVLIKDDFILTIK